MAKNVTVRSVQAFIRGDLTELLRADLREHRITMEADLEVCAYFHLRTFVSPDPRWVILARKHVRTGYYVDLILFKRAIPRLALELKWNRGKIDDKDRRSLKAAIEELRLNKAYFLATSVRRARYGKMEKAQTEKGRVFEVIVTLKLTDNEFKKWKQTRRVYRKEMKLGRVPKNESA